MRKTLTVTPIPTSQTAILRIGIFTTPSMFGGGGSPFTDYSIGVTTEKS
jgi:hypothetical protein